MPPSHPQKPDAIDRGLRRRFARATIRVPALPSEAREAALVMTALGLLLFSDCVFRGGVLFQRDLAVFFSGWMEAFARSAAEGSWPLWNPYPSFGQPMLATAIAQILYPTTWLNLVMSFPTYMAFFAVFHVAIAGLGGWALLRGLGASQRAALVSGSAWAASGPFLSTVHMPNMYAAAAWLPWALHLAHRTLATGRIRFAVLWAATMALMVLAGSPEMALMSLAALVSLLGDATVRESIRRRSGRTLALAALAGILAFALSAAQSLPTIEMQRQSMRASLSELDRTFWSNHPFITAQAVLPLSLDPLPLTYEARQLLFEGREPFFFSIYAGGALLALALAGLLAGRSPHRVGFAALALVALLLSYGPLTPLYGFARTALPVLAWFRFPAKAVMLTTLGFAVLVGLGVDAWSEVRRAGKAVWVLGIALPVAALAAVAFHLAQPDAPVWRLFVGPPLTGGGYETLEPFARMSRHLTVAGLLSATCGLAALARSLRPGPLPALAAAVALAGLGDLVIHMRELNPTVPRTVERFRPAILADVPRRRANRTLVLDYLHPLVSLRFLGRAGGISWPVDAPPSIEWAIEHEYPLVVGTGLWGIEGFPTDVPSLRSRAAETAVLRLQTDVTEGAHVRLLRALGVQYLVSLHEEGLGGELQLLDSHPIPWLGRVARLWSVPDPLPRAYWVGRARAREDVDLATSLVQDPTFDPRREVFLSGEGALAPITAAAGTSTGEARVSELKPDAIEIETEASSDGYLVVTEAFAPGWRAAVDGTTAPVLKANGLFRAVRVPAGHHHVGMRYRPLSVALGAVLSLASLFAAVALWTSDSVSGRRAPAAG